MIGIFLLTRSSIPTGQISLVWAVIGTGFLIAAFLLFRRQKPKSIFSGGVIVFLNL
jgi:hypothetical protein